MIKGKLLVAQAGDTLSLASIIENLSTSSDDNSMTSQYVILKAARDKLILNGVSKSALKEYQEVSRSLFANTVKAANQQFGSWRVYNFCQQFLGARQTQPIWGKFVIQGVGYSVVTLMQSLMQGIENKSSLEDLQAIAMDIRLALESMSGNMYSKICELAAPTNQSALRQAVRYYSTVSNITTVSSDEGIRMLANAKAAGKDASDRIKGQVVGLDEILGGLKSSLPSLNNNDYLKSNYPQFLKRLSDIAESGAIKSKDLEYLDRQFGESTISFLGESDPQLGSTLRAMKSKVKTVRDNVATATNAEFMDIINNSKITDEQAEQWVKGLNLTPTAKKLFADEGGISEHLKKLYKLCNGKLSKFRSIQTKSGRAHATFGTGQVTLDSKGASDVLWHEVAHFIEYSSPELLSQAKAFLTSRIDPLSKYKYVQLSSSGRRAEIGVNGNFGTPYTGRVYGDKTIEGTDATEVFSMGIQMAMNGEYALSSCLADDGVLEFVLGALKGLHD